MPRPSAFPFPLPASSDSSASRRAILVAAVLLALAVIAAYSNSFSGPFTYDDNQSIPSNTTIRHLWPPGDAWSPPAGGVTVGGRPVLNFSLALSYALGGTDVRAYHAGNLAIHLFAALVLFGLVRRTLLLPRWAGRFAAAALPLALASAALWALHPLQTESVTYMVQRAESLMGLFYLLTFYGFVRGATAERPWPFYLLSIGACALGGGTKEVIVSAPVLVLLFDRTFVAGNFQAAWEKRRGYYAALAATWIPLGWLVLANGGNRGGSIGFGIGVSWWDHALTQGEAITRYLALSFWPHPLAFDYGPFWVHGLAILPYSAVVLGLLGGTAWALWRRPVAGFLGAWFLAILAPTSLLPGPTQMIVEHRMYLSLAAVVVAFASALHLAAGRRALTAALAVALAFGVLTFRRNEDYRTNLALWQDTVVKRPGNAIAHCNLGAALSAAGRKAEAEAEYDRTLQLDPDNPEAHINLGEILSEAGRPAEAMPHLFRALVLAPGSAALHLNLGTALDRVGRTAEAVHHYERALLLDPELADAHNDLGNVLLRDGRADEALKQLDEALRLRPDYAGAHYNRASALAKLGRMPEADAEFERGRRLNPDDAVARHGWANTLTTAGRVADALPEFEVSLRLNPNDSVTHYDYGTALAAAGRLEPAIAQYTEAVRLNPNYAEAHNNLGNAFIMLGRNAEAVPEYQAAFRLRPDNAAVCNNLGLALARLGHIREAAGYFETAVKLAPNYQDARANLQQAQAALRSGAP
ncbi:MAG TPA: tetratricopeptide repeat protein [Opitutaceae bacterium]|nr:tetratricopeptide repeat protein [Opitutaceae bacterium]